MMRFTTAQQRMDRHGHVLLMTLMVLAIAVVIVTGVSKHSIGLARTAARERQELQEKWGVASCQRFVFDNRDHLLSRTGQPQANVSGVVQLATQTIRFDLNDESAKLDVNTLNDVLSRQEATSILRRLAGASVLKIQLRPLDNVPDGLRIEPYESWGQVFRTKSRLNATDLYNATRKISCWGGRINYKTADVDVIRSGVKAAAGAIVADRIVREVESEQHQSLDGLLTKIGATEQQARATRQVLSDQSRAYSVWIASKNGSRVNNHFVVQERFAGDLIRYQSFSLK